MWRPFWILESTGKDSGTVSEGRKICFHSCAQRVWLTACSLCHFVLPRTEVYVKINSVFVLAEWALIQNAIFTTNKQSLLGLRSNLPHLSLMLSLDFPLNKSCSRYFHQKENNKVYFCSNYQTYLFQGIDHRSLWTLQKLYPSTIICYEITVKFNTIIH